MKKPCSYSRKANEETGIFGQSIIMNAWLCDATFV